MLVVEGGRGEEAEEGGRRNGWFAVFFSRYCCRAGELGTGNGEQTDYTTNPIVVISYCRYSVYIRPPVLLSSLAEKKKSKKDEMDGQRLGNRFRRPGRGYLLGADWLVCLCLVWLCLVWLVLTWMKGRRKAKNTSRREEKRRCKRGAASSGRSRF